MQKPIAMLKNKSGPTAPGVLLKQATILALLLAVFTPVQASPMRVAVISDLNGAYGTTSYRKTVDDAVNQIITLRPDLVINTGDMVAGQRIPHLTRSQVEPMWAAYHGRVSEPLNAAGIPVAVTPGNHDGSSYPGFSLERAIYREQWLTRKPEFQYVDDSNYPWYYAFAMKNVLFIGLDATATGHLPAAQMNWLNELLEQHGQDYSTRILFSHLPLWPFAEGRQREYIGDPALQALLDEHAVKLYLSGHHHAFYPGFHHQTAMVSQSCLGAGPRRLLGSGSRSPRSFTLIEIDGGDIRLAAYRAPTFSTQIDWLSLPEHISSDASLLIRADLVKDGNVRPLQQAAAETGEH